MSTFSKLLGSLLLFASPIPVLAQSQEQTYLVVFAAAGLNSGIGMTSEVIPMRDIEACNAAGVKLMTHNKDGGNIQGVINRFRLGYDCINGVR